MNQHTPNLFAIICRATWLVATLSCVPAATAQTFQLNLSTIPADGGTATASGNYVPGHINVSVSNSGEGGGSYSRGTVTETLTLTSPTLAPGTDCLFRYSYYVSPVNVSAQFIGVGGGVSAFVQFGDIGHLTLPSDILGSYEKVISVNGSGTGFLDFQSDNFPANHLISATRAPRSGEPFALEFRLWTEGGMGGGSPGSGSYSTSADAYWNGVLEVTTLDGTPVTDFSLINEDGVDFGHSFAPVPEPAHYAALAGTGLLAFAIWRRTRRVQVA